MVLIKKSAPQQEEGNHYSVIHGLLYRSSDATCFFHFQSESPFVYKVINKTKLSMINFQKQSPQNIKESLSLNTFCTYNNLYILFVLFNHLFIILFVGFASITWKYEELWCNSIIMNKIPWIHMECKQLPNFVSEFTV